MLLSLTTLLLAAAPPEVALLSARGQDTFSELRFQPVGAAAPVPPLARVEHLAGESVQGALLPGRRAAVVVAVTAPGGDLSFASQLFLLEPGKPARALVDRVMHGARPLATASGRVFVARGRVGGPEFDARATLRVDELSLDEVDVRTGAVRTVLSFPGYAVFPVGEWRGALVVFRVTAQGGEFLTVHPDALGVTPVARVAPQARDFSVDARAGAVLFTQVSDDGGGWQVVSLDLSGQGAKSVARGETMALLPTAFPDGRIGVAAGPGQGLWSASRGEAALPSQGPGFDRVRAFGRGGDLAVGTNELADGSATTFAVEWKTGRSQRVATDADARLDVLGVFQP